MAHRPRTRIFTPAALTVGAVSMSDLKAHLRVTSSAEDDAITAYGIAATAAVERWTQRIVMTRAAALSLQELPSGKYPIELPGGSIISLTSVVADAVTITGCTTIGHSPALLLPATDWPTIVGDGYPVTITYQVGMATIPQDLNHAVKLLVGEMYERRANAIEGPLTSAILSAEYLMAPHRIWAAA